MQKMRKVLKRILECMSFFARYFVFEIWSILYSTVVNSELRTYEIFEPENLILCEPDSDANQ